VIGLLIVDDVIAAPWRGFKFILKQLQKQVNDEMLNEDLVQEKLLELEFDYELGVVNKEEYETKREGLLTRLRQIKEYKSETDQVETEPVADSSFATNIQDLGEEFEGE